MTREGQGIGPEETPPPPTSTRWSQPESGDDAEMLPPFVPGRKQTSEPAQEPGAEADADAFPFDEPAEEQEQPEQEQPADARTVDDEPFPWADDPADDASGIGADSAADSAAEPPTDPWSEEPDVEPWTPESESDMTALERAPIEADAEDSTGAALELADRLETLAKRLRAAGARGVEGDMASADRMTALLAGLVAGYLAGREG